MVGVVDAVGDVADGGDTSSDTSGGDCTCGKNGAHDNGKSGESDGTGGTDGADGNRGTGRMRIGRRSQ